MAANASPRIRVNGRDFESDGARLLRIGRDPAAEIHIDNPKVSRHHGELQGGPGGWVFRDVGSRNGTFLNGQRVSQVAINGPLQFRLGGASDGAVLDVAPVQQAAPAAAPPPQAPPPPQPQEVPVDAGPTVPNPAVHAPPPQQAQPPAPRPAAPPPAQPPAPQPQAPAAQPAAPVEAGAKPGQSPPTRMPTAIHDAPQTGNRIRIGRAPDNDIVLDDLVVSRRHAEIVRSGSGWVIQDAGSHNGTFLNGQRVKQATIGEGDLVSLGRHLFRFRQGKLEEYVDTGEVTLQAIDLQVRTSENKLILDHVSFSLDPNSFLAVVGPSGSGKSTLTNALNGFQPATAGTVLYGGRDLYASYDDIRRRIGYVPQDDILHPQLTVQRALEYAAELRFPPDVTKQARQARIKEVLEELDLGHRADLPIEKLSGGQRKRVSVALELLTKPSLLFLDEPTSGLDPGNERQVMALLRELADGGRTVIVVTHSTQSLHLCDRVAFLAPGGRLAYFGPPAEALAYFQKHQAGNFYADVFTKLEEKAESDWPAMFRADLAYDKYVQRPLAAAAVVRAARPTQPTPPPRQQPWFTQFSTLTRRYLALIRSDRRYMLLLLLQAPVLGLVLFLMFGLPVKPAFINTSRLSSRHAPEATGIVMALAIGATWFGLLNAVREIVKEFPVYRRERSVGLSISAYVASKAVVLGIFTFISSLLLTYISLYKQQAAVVILDRARFERTGTFNTTTTLVKPLLLGSFKSEVLLGLFITGLSAMALGLFLSAFARNADKALTIVPIVIVPQLILAGGFFPVGAPGIAQASWLASAQWGTSAVSSSIDMNDVQGPTVFGSYIISQGFFNQEGNSQKIQACAIKKVQRGEDPNTAIDECRNQLVRDIERGAFQAVEDQANPNWTHDRATWLKDLFVLLLLTAGGLFGTLWALKRRDLHVLAEPARTGPAALFRRRNLGPAPPPPGSTQQGYGEPRVGPTPGAQPQPYQPPGQPQAPPAQAPTPAPPPLPPAPPRQ